MIRKKKTKSKTTAKKTAKRKSRAKAKPETNPAEVRKEVSKMVESEATEIAEAVIDEAKKGQLVPTKYLFEMAGIYPPTQDGTQATPEEDCLAKILLDRLKAAAKPVEEGEGEAGSGAPARAISVAAEEGKGDCGNPDGDEARAEGEVESHPAKSGKGEAAPEEGLVAE
jgi:hypothetical protein